MRKPAFRSKYLCQSSTSDYLLKGLLRGETLRLQAVDQSIMLRDKTTSHSVFASVPSVPGFVGSETWM